MIPRGDETGGGGDDSSSSERLMHQFQAFAEYGDTFRPVAPSSPSSLAAVKAAANRNKNDGRRQQQRNANRNRQRGSRWWGGATTTTASDRFHSRDDYDYYYAYSPPAPPPTTSESGERNWVLGISAFLPAGAYRLGLSVAVALGFLYHRQRRRQERDRSRTEHRRRCKDDDVAASTKPTTTPPTTTAARNHNTITAIQSAAGRLFCHGVIVVANAKTCCTERAEYVWAFSVAAIARLGRLLHHRWRRQRRPGHAGESDENDGVSTRVAVASGGTTTTTTTTISSSVVVRTRSATTAAATAATTNQTIREEPQEGEEEETGAANNPSRDSPSETETDEEPPSLVVEAESGTTPGTSLTATRTTTVLREEHREPSPRVAVEPSFSRTVLISTADSRDEIEMELSPRRKIDVVSSPPPDPSPQTMLDCRTSTAASWPLPDSSSRDEILHPVGTGIDHYSNSSEISLLFPRRRSGREEARADARLILEYSRAFRRTLARHGVHVDERTALERAFQHVEFVRGEDRAAEREMRRYQFEYHLRAADRHQREQMHSETQQVLLQGGGEQDWRARLVRERSRCIAAAGSAGVWSAAGVLAVRALDAGTRMRRLGATDYFRMAADWCFGDCSTNTRRYSETTDPSSYWLIPALQGVTYYIPSIEEGTCYVHRGSTAAVALLLLLTAISVAQRLPRTVQNAALSCSLLFASAWAGAAPLSSVRTSVVCYLLLWSASAVAVQRKFKAATTSLGGNKCGSAPSIRQANQALEWFDDACLLIQAGIPVLLTAIEAIRVGKTHLY